MDGNNEERKEMSELSAIEVPLRQKNIVLIGFMGVGKTTVGQLVASKLYRDFVDVDLELEKKYNMSVTDIFANMGEKKFREMEEEFICELVTSTRLKVISLGGGAFVNEKIRKTCLESSIVFYLDLSWDSWKKRLHMIMNNRPVLQDKSLEEIEELFYRRQNYYENNNSKIATDDLNPEEVADYLVSSLKLGWELYE